MRLILQAMIVAAAVLTGVLAPAQDSPSLGDAARLARQQKLAKEAKAKAGEDVKTPRVITEQQMPEHPELAPKAVGYVEHGNTASAASEGKLPAEQWKAQIQKQQELVRSQEAELQKLKDSIQFAPGNCVSGCVQWNQAQKDKQDRAERMQSALDQYKQKLQDMQENARQQGYGSSVYEP